MFVKGQAVHMAGCDPDCDDGLSLCRVQEVTSEHIIIHGIWFDLDGVCRSGMFSGLSIRPITDDELLARWKSKMLTRMLSPGMYASFMADEYLLSLCWPHLAEVYVTAFGSYGPKMIDEVDLNGKTLKP